ncbi:hypothetical protein [Pedobacter sp. UBA4863]|uniref:hypothetical protein n=1 Tax=Pedobacter sp. UBA4863 TaxID=1947060 RepID=UPI0025EE7CA0|nr:hypothetical protein [Pedobacter sp. UBA4863]
MATLLFVISIVCFITTFGIHSVINNKSEIDKPMYLSTPLVFIPIICGFILPIIPFHYLLHYNWILLSIGNIAVLYILGPIITKAYLVRLSTGNLGKDMVYTLGLGIVLLIIGIIVYHS